MSQIFERFDNPPLRPSITIIHFINGVSKKLPFVIKLHKFRIHTSLKGLKSEMKNKDYYLLPHRLYCYEAGCGIYNRFCHNNKQVIF